MDTLFIVVCLVLAGSVFIPFFLFNAAGKAANKKLSGKVKQVIGENNLKMADSESWGNSYIGLDTDQGKILFLKMRPSDCTWQVLDLSAITDCQVKEQRKVLKVGHKKELLLEKLDLEISRKNGEPLVFNFYDSNENRMEDFELARAEKWKTRVIRHTSKNPMGKTAA